MNLVSPARNRHGGKQWALYWVYGCNHCFDCLFFCGYKGGGKVINGAVTLWLVLRLLFCENNLARSLGSLWGVVELVSREKWSIVLL